MVKYAVAIDYKARSEKKIQFQIKPLEAKTIDEAKKEAEKFFTDEVYMLSIAKKFGKSEKEGFAKVTHYKDILESRVAGSWCKRVYEYEYKRFEGKTWSAWNCL